MRFLTATTDPISLWLLKWVFLPLIGLFLIAAFVSLESGKAKCAELAKDRGYQNSRYIPGTRSGSRGASCLLKGRIQADGSVDRTASVLVGLRSRAADDAARAQP